MKRFLLAVGLSCVATWASAADSSLAPLLEKLRAVGPNGSGHREATAAWQELVRVAQPRQLTDLLASMDGANPLAMNWLRAAVDAIAERLQKGKAIPAEDLEKFLADTKHSPLARRAAFEWLIAAQPEQRAKLLPTLLNDPSLEIRRDAIADAFEKAEAKAQAAGDDKSAAIATFRQLLLAARDEDQIKSLTERLRKLGDKVDLPSHFGFIQKWKIIGPFDNAGAKGFDVAYGPEKELDLTATHDGKEPNSKLKWVDFETTEDYGHVDLNKGIAKQKGVIAYAYHEFMSADERDVELRIGCVTANKVWLNGQLLTNSSVYHSGTHLDQYVGKGRLKAGKNVILVKVAQNEQTETWAVDWKFQLRVCDHLGTAVLAQNR